MGNEESISTVSLNREKLMRYRQKFPAHEDADGFEIIG